MTSAATECESGFVPLPGSGQIAYQIHGQHHPGLPVLLIRPLGGSMALLGVFRTILGARFKVLSFDLRGTGRSSADPNWPSTRDLARDSLQVLAHLNVARAHVFGISLGGMTATWLTLLAPKKVERLCVASTPTRGLAISHTSLRRELALAACFARARIDVEATLVDRVLSHGFRAAHPDRVREIERLVRAEPGSRSELLKHALAGLRHDASGSLSRIHTPTLVLAGDGDTLLGPDAVHRLSSSIRGAQFEIIANSGHDLTLEQPEVTAERVAAFFSV
jgi:3-oxoadipate enol-lactonase